MSHQDTIEPTLGAAKMLVALGQTTKALTLYDRLLAENPGDSEGWLQKGLLHTDMANFVAASEALERARDLAPNDARVYFHLARIAASLGRTLSAIDLLRTARAIEPDNGEIGINLAQALVTARRWKSAWAITDPMGDALAGWWAGVRSAAREGLVRAEARAAELIALRRTRGAPLERDLALTLAHLLVSLDYIPGALEICRRLIGEDAADLSALLVQTSALAHSEGTDAALAALDEAVGRFAGSPVYEMAVARLCFEVNDMDRAIAHAASGKAADRHGYALMLLAALRWDELFALCRTWIGETDNTAPFALLLRALAGLGKLRMLSDVPAPDASAGAIPAVIVQFWDSSDLPEDVVQAVATWREQNPDFVHRLFDEATARAFIAQAHGEPSAQAFDHCHHPAMKADFFRVAYLLVEGGIYVDADDGCVRPIRDLVHAIGDAHFAASVSGDAAPYVHNWFLAAAPGNPLLRSAMTEMVALIDRVHAAGETADIWHTTGPGLITRSIARQLVETPEAADDTVLLTTQQYRGYAVSLEDLDYKKTSVGNWRRSNEQRSPKMAPADDMAPQGQASQDSKPGIVESAEVGEAFAAIYDNNSWGNGSGPGSSPNWTIEYRGFLEKFIRMNGVASIVDIGCGDWQFTRFINLEGIHYHGFDVVPPLIERNRLHYAGDSVRFDVMPDDLSQLPRADLLLIKDVLQHLPDSEIQRFREQVFGRYRFVLLTNSFEKIDSHRNVDLSRPGEFRCLDLAAAPYAMEGAYLFEFWAQPWERIRAFLISNPVTVG